MSQQEMRLEDQSIPTRNKGCVQTKFIHSFLRTKQNSTIEKLELLKSDEENQIKTQNSGYHPKNLSLETMKPLFFW